MNDTKLIENFIKCDFLIKKEIIKLSPQDSDFYNINTLIDYSNKLVNGIDKIFDLFEKMIKMPYLGSLANYLEEKKKYMMNYLEGLSITKDSLNSFYKKYCADMNENYISRVKQEISGYYLFSDVNSTIINATSINEILHTIHFYIFNNENIYHSLPILMQKQNKEGALIKLYGSVNKVSEELYNGFNYNLNVGITDILSIPSENKIFIMVRNVGHALSLEITLNDSYVEVNYFIPIVRHVNKTNMLKGIEKVNEDDKYAIGRFETNPENLTEDLIDFISKVPTDKDYLEMLHAGKNQFKI